MPQSFFHYIRIALPGEIIRPLRDSTGDLRQRPITCRRENRLFDHRERPDLIRCRKGIPNDHGISENKLTAHFSLSCPQPALFVSRAAGGWQNNPRRTKKARRGEKRESSPADTVARQKPRCAGRRKESTNDLGKDDSPNPRLFYVPKRAFRPAPGAVTMQSRLAVEWSAGCGIPSASLFSLSTYAFFAARSSSVWITA